MVVSSVIVVNSLRRQLVRVLFMTSTDLSACFWGMCTLYTWSAPIQRVREVMGGRTRCIPGREIGIVIRIRIFGDVGSGGVIYSHSSISTNPFQTRKS